MSDGKAIKTQSSLMCGLEGNQGLLGCLLLIAMLLQPEYGYLLLSLMVIDTTPNRMVVHLPPYDHQNIDDHIADIVRVT
jgi:hypothetical protein